MARMKMVCKECKEVVDVTGLDPGRKTMCPKCEAIIEVPRKQRTTQMNLRQVKKVAARQDEIEEDREGFDVIELGEPEKKEKGEAREWTDWKKKRKGSRSGDEK